MFWKSARMVSVPLVAPHTFQVAVEAFSVFRNQAFCVAPSIVTGA